MSEGRVRVLVYARTPAEDADAVAREYHKISKVLAGTPGLLGNELVRSVGEPGAFIVMSEWASLTAFQDWERGADHRQTTAPLRPYQDAGAGRTFGIYEVVAAY